MAYILADFLGTVGWLVVFAGVGAAAVGYFWLKSRKK